MATTREKNLHILVNKLYCMTIIIIILHDTGCDDHYLLSKVGVVSTSRFNLDKIVCVPCIIIYVTWTTTYLSLTSQIIELGS